MSYIINLPKIIIENGNHNYLDADVLISICDQGAGIPDYSKKSSFKELHRYYIPDIDLLDCDDYRDQIEDIGDVLQNAINNNKNVVVHCTAGLSRSGAVVEAALLLGFKETPEKPLRTPNQSIFQILRRYLGFKHSFE